MFDPGVCLPDEGAVCMGVMIAGVCDPSTVANPNSNIILMCCVNVTVPDACEKGCFACEGNLTMGKAARDVDGNFSTWLGMSWVIKVTGRPTEEHGTV